MEIFIDFFLKMLHLSIIMRIHETQVKIFDLWMQITNNWLIFLMRKLIFVYFFFFNSRFKCEHECSFNILILINNNLIILIIINNIINNKINEKCYYFKIVL